MSEEIIEGTFDVSKGNQKYAKKYSPVEDWYKAENNMLDGINVAECVHFTRQYNYGYCELSNDSCNEFQYNCAKNKNCYFKQLKRLQAENERLEKEIWQLQHCQMWDKEATLQAELLIKENEQLKETNEKMTYTTNTEDLL